MYYKTYDDTGFDPDVGHSVYSHTHNKSGEVIDFCPADDEHDAFASVLFEDGTEDYVYIPYLERLP